MNNVIEKLMSKYPNKTIFTSKEIKAAAVEIGENPRSAYTAVKYTNNCPSPHRGSYNLERMMPKSSIPSKAAPEMVKGVESVSNDEVFVPDFDPTFVPWGNFTEIR